MCHMCNCNNWKITGTKTCEVHQREWDKYIQTYNQQSFHGARRIVQRQGENLPWQATLKIIHNLMMSLLLRDKVKIIQFCSFLLCGNNLCYLWCCHCKVGITNKHLRFLAISFSNWGIKTWLYMHWQSLSCLSHCYSQ